MGRKVKQGIDYFLVSVKYLEDCKIDKLNNEVGIKGIAILHFFYAIILYQGYYIKFENLEYLIWLINKYFYHDNFKKLELKEIIKTMITCNLIDKDLFNQGILSSKEVKTIIMK